MLCGRHELQRGTFYIVSPDKKSDVEHICTRWGGPVALAVFVPYTNRTALPFAKVPQGCSIELGFAQVLHRAEDTKELEAYPVNVLRNKALRLVSTSHFFTVDIDFWPSSNLRAEILRHILHVIREPRLALVFALVFDAAAAAVAAASAAPLSS